MRISCSDGQALATFRAPPSENLTAGASGHARTKPVGAFTMQVARLISALHAETRREKCVKTSTWWAKKKGGKGTRRVLGCQADMRRVNSVCDVPRPVDNPIALGIDSPFSRVACA